MAATDDIRTRRKRPDLGYRYGYPVLAGEIIYGGAAVGLTAALAAVPAGHASAVALLGFADERADNRAGVTGDLLVTVERDVRLIPLAGATAADIGKTVYASADDTFSLSAGVAPNTLLALGKIAAIDAEGVWLSTL